jgi:hypothetical protein
MNIQTHFLDKEERPLSDKGGKPLISPYTGELAAGTKVKIAGHVYKIIESYFVLDPINQTLGYYVTLREIKPSFVVRLSQEHQFYLGAIMFVLSLVIVGIIYITYLNDPTLFWGVIGVFLRWGVPILFATLGFLIAYRIEGSHFSDSPTFLGLYLSFVFSWGGLWAAFGWLGFLAPPFPLKVFPSDYVAYNDYFRQQFDLVRPTLVGAFGWLSLTLGFLGVEGIGKLIQFLGGQIKKG